MSDDFHKDYRQAMRDAEEQLEAERKARAERERARAENERLAAIRAHRRAIEEDHANSPSMEALQAKYGGPGWGITQPKPSPERVAKRERTLAEVDELNKRAFSAMCVEAGLPANSMVSPMLHAMIQRDLDKLAITRARVENETRRIEADEQARRGQ